MYGAYGTKSDRYFLNGKAVFAWEDIVAGMSLSLLFGLYPKRGRIGCRKNGVRSFVASLSVKRAGFGLYDVG